MFRLNKNQILRVQLFTR